MPSRVKFGNHSGEMLRSFVMGCDVTHLGRVSKVELWPDVDPPHSHLYSTTVSCRTAQRKRPLWNKLTKPKHTQTELCVCSVGVGGTEQEQVGRTIWYCWIISSKEPPGTRSRERLVNASCRFDCVPQLHIKGIIHIKTSHNSGRKEACV